LPGNTAAYGYRKIAELLRQAGWTINDKRVERIWRREGLKVPQKQPKRGRLWLAAIRVNWEFRDPINNLRLISDDVRCAIGAAIAHAAISRHRRC
jgi:transposase InsO family protein